MLYLFKINIKADENVDYRQKRIFRFYRSSIIENKISKAGYHNKLQ